MNKQKAFTLVELLVVIMVIGLLIALLLPAINSVRGAARSVQCKNNLRQLAVATINYESATRSFPPARVQPRPDNDDPDRQCGGNGVSWIVHILPYIEENNFSKGWRIYDDFASHSLQVRQQPLHVLVCPERRSVEDAVLNLPVLQNGGTKLVPLDRNPQPELVPLAAGCG